MNRLGRTFIMSFLGAIGMYLVISGEFGVFLQQRMRLPLLIGSIVLVVFGLVEARITLREASDHDDAHGHHEHDGDDHHHDHQEAHHHDHHQDHHGHHDHDGPSRGPAVGWLLGLPIIVLMFAAPPSLGAAASQRVAPIIPPQTLEFDPIDLTESPVEMKVWDFVTNAVWNEAQSLDGIPVQLEGVVVNDPDVTDGFLLTRFVVSCCAADGTPIQVVMRNWPTRLEDDSWVVVEAVWTPPSQPYDTADTVAVEATALSVTVAAETPNDPYETPTS